MNMIWQGTLLKRRVNQIVYYYLLVVWKKKKLKGWNNSISISILSCVLSCFLYLLLLSISFWMQNFRFDWYSKVFFFLFHMRKESHRWGHRRHVEEQRMVVCFNMNVEVCMYTTRIILYWTLGAATTCFSHLLHYFLLQSILHISSSLLFCSLFLSFSLSFFCCSEVESKNENEK